MRNFEHSIFLITGGYKMNEREKNILQWFSA